MNIASVLELGCGTGGHAKYLLKKSELRYLGIDKNLEFIKAAKKKVNQKREINFIVGDINYLPIKYIKFDLIILMFHVVNFLEIGQLKKLFTNLSKMLSENGAIVFDSWNSSSPTVDKVTEKILKIENKKLTLLRKSRILRISDSKTQVFHTFDILDHEHNTKSRYEESHIISTLNKQNILSICSNSFRNVDIKDNSSNLPPSDKTFSLFVVLSNPKI
jgi:SAM-dependent methyltransferase